MINIKDKDFKFNKDNFYGLYIGRGGYWIKGLDRVVKFSKKIYNLNRKYRLVIIGSDYKKVKHLLNEPFIIYKGVVDNKDLKKYYKKAKLFFQFSRYEGGSPTLVLSECYNLSKALVLYTEDSSQGEFLDGHPMGYPIDNFDYEEAKDVLEEIGIKINPKISILTTVYNGEMFLEETIKSVLNQTFKDFEYIIVDDGSNDRTKEIISSFNDPRIKYFYAGENKGFFEWHKSLNFGLDKCEGKYIARIDADDIMLPNRLQVQYDYLEKHKDIFLIGSSAKLIDEKGNEIGAIIKNNYPSFLYKYRISSSNSFIHSSIFFRNEGMKYPSYNELHFYVDLIFNKKKIRNISDILIKYRINPYGMMSKYSNKK